MTDVNHVFDRTPNHTLGAGIGAASNGHHARDGFEIGLDSAVALAFFKCSKVLGALLCGLLRIGRENFADHLLVALFDLFNACVIAHDEPHLGVFVETGAIRIATMAPVEERNLMPRLRWPSCRSATRRCS